MDSDQALIGLIEEIYQASLLEGGWNAVVRAVSSHMGAVGGVVLDIDSTDRSLLRVVSEGLNDSADDFAVRMYGLDPRVSYVLAKSEKQTVYDYVLTDEHEMRHHEFYDWLQTECGVKYFIGSRLNDSGPITTLTAIAYTAKHGHASEQEVERFRVLSPHIANAWQVTKLKQQANAASMFADMIGAALPWGVIGLDPSGKCVALNHKAEALFRLEDGLSLAKNGRIRAAFAAVDRTLQILIGEVLRSNSGDSLFAGRAISVPRPSRRPDFALQILPGMNRQNERDPEAPAVLVMISDPSDPVSIDAGQLQTLFGLTHRESQLVCALVSGSALTEVARMMGISHNTARVHLQNVFRKTNTRSQPDLINRMKSIYPRMPGEHA